MLLSIDPGNVQSGYCILDGYKPIEFGKVDNDKLERIVKQRCFIGDIENIVIEMVKSYGMAVGQTVFDTCVEIGRLQMIAEEYEVHWSTVGRKEYVTELCGSAKAKDANVRQYLIDRFAKDVPNYGKGTKQNPGWFYGFKADCWQAYAIGVYWRDR